MTNHVFRPDKPPPHNLIARKDKAKMSSSANSMNVDDDMSAAGRKRERKRDVDELELERLRVRRLRRALRFGLKLSPKEIEAIEEREIPKGAGESRLESLSLDILGLVVQYVSAPNLLGSLAVASQALREAVRVGRSSRGWDAWIRRSLKMLYELGEDKYWGLNFLVGDQAVGRANIVEAASWGLRSAVATCKWHGWGAFNEDREAAVALYRVEHGSIPSAESGGKCKWAVHYLAMCYLRAGEGVARDHTKGIELLHEAADERDNPVAMDNLGGLLSQAFPAEAVSYRRKASEAGFAGASGRLGRMYEDGVYGVIDVDLAEAAKLLEIAKERCPLGRDDNGCVWAEELNRVLQKIAGTWTWAGTDDDDVDDDDDEEEEEEEEEEEDDNEQEEEE